MREIITRAGLQPTGNFHEPITGLEGFEVARSGCPAPIAVLPVMAANAEMAPGELSYRDGDYNIAYAFDGNLYAPDWISYRLGIMSAWRRVTSLALGSDPDSVRYYMKIWTPRGCQGLTQEEVERLREADQTLPARR